MADRTITSSFAQYHFFHLLDSVKDGRTIITEDGKPVAVLISVDEIRAIEKDIADKTKAIPKDHRPSGKKPKCEGACERHHAGIQRVHVYDGLKSWGKFWYCGAAIISDRDNGLRVDICE